VWHLTSSGGLPSTVPPAQREPPLSCDLLVVGAGPAGAAAAAHARLRAPGLATWLVDQQAFPRDKACGDGVGPGVVARLVTLGAGHIVAGRRPIERVTIVGPSGATAGGDLPPVGGNRPVGYVVPRVDFDAALFHHACRLGAISYAGWRMTSLDTSMPGHVQVRLARAGEALSVRARAVIAADGVRSTIRRCLGVPYNRPRHTGLAIRAYVTAPAPVFQDLEFPFLAPLLPGYGWVFPLDATHANVGVMLDASRYRHSPASLEVLLAQFLRAHAARHGAPLDLHGRKAYMLSFGSQLPRLAHGRVALIGDAGSQVNPFTGEGIAYALAAAMLAVDSLRTTGIDAPRPFAAYERAFRARFERHFRASQFAKRLARSRRFADWAIRAAARSPVLVAKSTELLMGEGTTVSPRSLLTVLTHGWRWPAAGGSSRPSVVRASNGGVPWIPRPRRRRATEAS